ncbi:MAG: extracellular solute-binding protein [Chloroflexi bacterium]|nr:extracellular solute-binding protein [Chloroflexota bacterium]
MSKNRISRRDLLKGMGLTAAGAALAACSPQVVERTVRETVVVEVEGETQVQEVEKIVTVEVGSPEKTTVRWMTRVSDWGGQAGAAAVPELVRTYFYEENPDIIVVAEPAPPQWSDKLVTAMVAGDAPDVFEAWPDVFHNFVGRGLVLDLQPYVDADMTEETINDYIVAQWDALFINGIRAGLPLYVDLRLETYNKDLFDEYGVPYPPEDGDWTVDDYAATAAALTQDTNGDGEIDLWGTIIETGGWFYWMRMWGGDWVDPNDNTKCTLGSDESQEAFNFIYEQQWRRTPNVFAQPAQVENAWYYEAFVPEMVAMAEKGCYPARTVEEVGGAFRWDYAHVPRGPKGRKTLVDADGWSLWSGTQNGDAAWQLITFLSGPTFQEEVIARIAGAIPSRLSVVGSFIDIMRDSFEELQDVRLEVLQEILEEPGYGGNVLWFKNHLAAMEIIDPAMDLVFVTGEEEPSYFIEIAEQVNASQLEG